MHNPTPTILSFFFCFFVFLKKKKKKKECTVQMNVLRYYVRLEGFDFDSTWRFPIGDFCDGWEGRMKFLLGNEGEGGGRGGMVID